MADLFCVYCDTVNGKRYALDIFDNIALYTESEAIRQCELKNIALADIARRANKPQKLFLKLKRRLNYEF